MLINSQVHEGEYHITVARIKQLQDLLSQADKRLVNKFIDEVRAHVLTFHKFQFDMAGDSRKQELQLFFHELNNKAHQLSRFTLELSQLVKVAPKELFTEAKRADRAIDSIHGNLVNLCLTIDDMILRKKEFVVDATSTVQVIYDTYARIFDVTPTGKSFIEQVHVPPNQPLEDLLVPVLEVLMAKDHLRCHNLVLKIIENKGNARL
ncbi:MAG: hypothetical protein HKP09_02135 [Enterobacterales bacterium]|nr:hypothetical protein [Enterobacterales bacterium]